MKTEEAIERLQRQIEYKEEWMEFWKRKGATDYRLRDTELDLEMLRMAVQALKSSLHGHAQNAYRECMRKNNEY